MAWFTDIFDDEVEQEGEPDSDGEGDPLFPGGLGQEMLEVFWEARKGGVRWHWEALYVVLGLRLVSEALAETRMLVTLSFSLNPIVSPTLQPALRLS